MLEVQNVTRSFGDRRVLDDVSFTVRPGRLTGFVGGNGAGKTTTMRIMLGVLTADSGTVSLDGSDLGTSSRRTFGYMPEERGLYPKMKLQEQIVYLGRLHGMTAADATTSTERLLERLSLGERRDDPIESLSLGNQQRAQIAASLVHDPEVLVLDEPFSGLDPIAVETVLGVLTERAAQGVPVLFSSHQLDIVERLCDDVVVIAEGRIRASGDREELRDQHSRPLTELQIAGDGGWVRDVPGVEVVEFDGGYVLFEADEEARQRVLAEAVSRGSVTGFTRRRPTLSEIFQEVVQ
ncbi:ABC transporter ATP-binding protein [Clavibacter sepedonicus]|uniref:ABC transporter ATP-binding protein n=1 Tax=Clavibacter sepedonicus TaxID=31964 RepID=B0RFK1_CLASE|nr:MULTISPECIES: ATP-binding cassette domain-containing protein [Clavibacter]MBD5380368.1 ATP-binding cassette domain-containing protein [Clavibacter sp.]OQJ49408.1 ABC transporter ATP-binding protein [Clavibacter sepedonicus]OQJ55021.1 ABC transporter ATP-binding protein [Clavibacter sepedonicus]UUK64730.1 ATP-binding cassette domain-containing protein [Clavibacter sepedonicus]CAQ01062.1 putative ABC transporter ATP-binding protein [Clavibacter sepedonicus]